MYSLENKQKNQPKVLKKIKNFYFIFIKYITKLRKELIKCLLYIVVTIKLGLI